MHNLSRFLSSLFTNLADFGQFQELSFLAAGQLHIRHIYLYVMGPKGPI